MQEENEIINKTHEVWQPYYKEKLSFQELGEITHNVISLVNLLNQWKQKEVNQSSKNTNKLRRINQ